MKLPVLSLLAAATLSLASCSSGNNADTTDTTTSSATAPADSASMNKPMGGDSTGMGGMSQNGAAKADPNGPTAPHANDKEFMMSAAHSDQNEIQMSKMALAKGVTGEAKTFANQMIADHTKSSAMLKPIAQKAGVTLPTDMDAEHKALAPTMEKLSGKEFETKYLAQMVADHQKVANTLAAHQKMTQNSDLQTWITNTLPVVEGHLSMAKKDGSMDNMKM